MTRRAKRIEAWAVVDECNWFKYFSTTRADAVLNTFSKEGERVARLVEHEPAAEAVVKAAIAFVNDESRGFICANESWTALSRAVERLEKSRARRNKK